MPTTNPVPSTDPVDLLFNAGKLDEVVNGAAQYYTDRLGVNRRTVEGISAAADVVLGGLGYAPPVTYAAGISLTLTTQTVEYSGEVYAPKVGNLPFTTSGTFETAKFRLIQGVAATDLAASGGSAMVGYIPAGTGAVATTVQSKLRESVSVKDFKCADGEPVKGDGIHDDTTGILAAIDSGNSLIFPKGEYAVTSLTINKDKIGVNYYFDGASLKGIASTATDCVLKFEGVHCKVYNLTININFNTNYKCGLWWYNSVTASQHNDFYSPYILYGKRGIVYGEFPGANTNTLAQSENTLFGYHTRGIEKPLYYNHANGVFFLESCMLVAGDEEWVSGFDYVSRTCFEAVAGVLVMNGGEIQSSMSGYNAATSAIAVVAGSVVHLNGVVTECVIPFEVSGELYINGGQVQNVQQDTPQFRIAPSANANTKLTVSACRVFRLPTVGSFSNKPLIENSGSSSSIDISFNDCDIYEWAKFVQLASANQQSVKVIDCRYYPDGTKDKRLETYLVNTAGQDIIDLPSIDKKGYTTDGWYLYDYTGGSSITLNSDVPNAYYANSINVTSTGTGGVYTVNAASLSTVKLTGFRVKPKDKFLIEGWFKRISSGTTEVGLLGLDSAGGFTTFIPAIDSNTITTDWKYLRAVFIVPDSASAVAYVGFGAAVVTNTIRFCGVRVRRADWNIN